LSFILSANALLQTVFFGDFAHWVSAKIIVENKKQHYQNIGLKIKGITLAGFS